MQCNYLLTVTAHTELTVVKHFVVVGLFYQQTPLHSAAREGHEITLMILLKKFKEADINFRDNDGVSVPLAID